MIAQPRRYSRAVLELGPTYYWPLQTNGPPITDWIAGVDLTQKLDGMEAFDYVGPIVGEESSAVGNPASNSNNYKYMTAPAGTGIFSFPLSLAFWAKPWSNSDASVTTHVAAWGNATNTDGDLQFYCNNGSKSFLEGKLGVNSTAGGVRGSTIIADDKWHLCAFVFPTNNIADAIIYVDGDVDPKSQTASGTMSVGDSGGELAVGNRLDTQYDRFFRGHLAHWLMFSRDLSAAEIEWLYKIGVGS
jgi:hypothetical protein